MRKCQRQSALKALLRESLINETMPLSLRRHQSMGKRKKGLHVHPVSYCGMLAGNDGDEFVAQDRPRQNSRFRMCGLYANGGVDSAGIEQVHRMIAIAEGLDIDRDVGGLFC